MAWTKFLGFLIVYFFCFASVVAQDKLFRPFYVELHLTPLLTFGASAEIKGGYDPYTYDSLQHLQFSFSDHAITPVELVFGYQRKLWKFQSSISYFSQDITITELSDWSTDGPKLATANVVSARVSALMLVSDPAKKPYGWYGGFFIGMFSATSFEIDPQAKVDYGIQDISNQTQWGLGIEGNFTFAVGQKGFYGNVGGSLTLPWIIGCVGKVQMESSGYTIIHNSIELYSLNFSAGIGYRLGKQK